MGLTATADRSPLKPGLAARRVAATVLAQVIDEGEPLDALLDAEHGMARLLALDPRDAGLTRAIARTAIRQRGPILFALDRLLQRPLPKAARHLHHLLHVGAAQVLFMGVEARAAIDLAVTEAKSDPRSQRFSGLVNAILRGMAREGDTLRAAAFAAHETRAPSWLVKRLKRDHGRAKTARILEAQAVEPVIDLTTKPGAVGLPDGVRLANGTLRTGASGAVTTWPGFDEGDWWVQDAAAALPALVLAHGGTRLDGTDVLDACAAPGGKTAQLAAMGARVTALEPVQARLRRLRGNLDRLALQAELHRTDLQTFAGGSERRFGAVLVDAPCSSTGTMRRHPDVAWTKTPEAVQAVAKLQRELVEAAAALVAAGGTLVFANCSILKEEGEDLFASLTLEGFEPSPIERSDVFGLDAVTGQGTLRTLPFQSLPAMEGLVPDDPAWQGMDGFFCARWRRRA